MENSTLGRSDFHFLFIIGLQLWNAAQGVPHNVNYQTATPLKCSSTISTTAVLTSGAPNGSSPCTLKASDFPINFPTVWYKLDKGIVPTGQRVVVRLETSDSSSQFGLLVLAEPPGCKFTIEAGSYGYSCHPKYGCNPKTGNNTAVFASDGGTTYYIGVSMPTNASLTAKLKLQCQAVPANKDPRQAKALPCGGAKSSGTTLGVRGLPDQWPCSVEQPAVAGIVWFRFNPTTLLAPNSVVTFLLDDAGQDSSKTMLVVPVAKGSSTCGVLQGPYLNNHPGTADYVIPTGSAVDVYIAVYDQVYSTGSEPVGLQAEGAFTLQATCKPALPPPPNDNFTSATPLACGGSAPVTFRGATADNPLPCTINIVRLSSGLTTGRFVWFKLHHTNRIIELTPPPTDRLVLVLGVKQVGGSCTFVWSPMGEGRPAPLWMDFRGDGVSPYYVALQALPDELTMDPGPPTSDPPYISVTCRNAVPNDNFQSAQSISCGQMRVGSVKGVTIDGLEVNRGYSTTPVHNMPCVRSAATRNELARFVWYNLTTPTSSGRQSVVATLSGGLAATATRVIVVSQSIAGGWDSGCAFEGEFPFSASPGVTYYIGVARLFSSEEGPVPDDVTAFNLQLTCKVSAVNDQYVSALPLSCNTTKSGSSVGAAGVLSQLPCRPQRSFTPRGAMWYYLEAAATPTYSLITLTNSNLAGSGWRVMVFGLSGKSSSPAARCLSEAYSEHPSQVAQLPVHAGLRYFYIGVYKDTGEGRFELKVTCSGKQGMPTNTAYNKASPLSCSSSVSVSTYEAPAAQPPCNASSTLLKLPTLWYKISNMALGKGKKVILQLGRQKDFYVEQFGVAVFTTAPRCQRLKVTGCNAQASCQPDRESAGRVVFTSDGTSYYFIAVSRDANASPQLLTVTCQTIPSNNDYSTATPLVCGRSLTATTAGASDLPDAFPCKTDPNRPPPASSGMVWFSLPANAAAPNALVTLAISDSAKQVMLVESDKKGKAQGACWSVVSLNASKVMFAEDSRAKQYIAVYGGQDRDFAVQVSCGKSAGTPTNDQYSSAMSVECSRDYSFTFTGVTYDTMYPCAFNTADPPGPGRFVWFKLSSTVHSGTMVHLFWGDDVVGLYVATSLVLEKPKKAGTSVACSSVTTETTSYMSKTLQFSVNNQSEYYIGLKILSPAYGLEYATWQLRVRCTGD